MRRLNQIKNHLTNNNSKSDKSTITITDNRTGKTYTLTVKDNYVKASDIEKIKSADGKPLRSYDPAYMNTICCTSKISYIDGDKGILQYRGFPIEVLAKHSSFIEVTYLLLFGSLPTSDQLSRFSQKVYNHTYIHSDLENMIKTFRYDAHPMGMLVSSIAAMSTLHPESNPALQGEKVYKDKKFCNKQIYRLLGNIPTISAYCYRHRIGRPFNQPRNDLSYVENFLYMMDFMNDSKYNPHPVLVRALDILFILHAEHELNCSTSAVRHLQSSGVDVYSCVAGGVAALYGPRHGGANEAVIRMLEAIGSRDNIPKYIEDVKNKKKTLFGFGHRVYKSYDPRAKIVRTLADDVFSVMGREPMIEIAMELEKIALTDEYFIKRNLYPNVDFYSGIIYKAMGFPTDMFPVLFSIPRVAGWLAHWLEFQEDPENKIARPRQNYIGDFDKAFIPINERKNVSSELESVESMFYKRRLHNK